jgi:hypothetical protein
MKGEMKLNVEIKAAQQYLDGAAGELGHEDPSLFTLPSLAEAMDDLAIIRELERKARYHITQRIVGILGATGATEALTADYKIKITEKLEYDRHAWLGLLEFIDMEELVESGAYTPAHEKTIEVDDKWDLGKVKTFYKRGDGIKEVITNSSFPAGYDVKVDRR